MYVLIASHKHNRIGSCRADERDTVRRICVEEVAENLSIAEEGLKCLTFRDGEGETGFYPTTDIYFFLRERRGRGRGR